MPCRFGSRFLCAFSARNLRQISLPSGRSGRVPVKNAFAQLGIVAAVVSQPNNVELQRYLFWERAPSLVARSIGVVRAMELARPVDHLRRVA